MPRIGYVYPAGGRQGTTMQTVLGGRYLDGATNVYFSGDGIQAAVLEHTKPLTQQQYNEAREKLQALQEKKRSATRNSGRRDRLNDSRNATNLAESITWTAQDERMLEDLRKQIANRASRQANPAISETVTLRVELVPDAAPGERELRLDTRLGLSNPLVFQVGQLPEFSESAARRGPSPKNVNPNRKGRELAKPPAPGERNISLPAVVNGQIMPGAVDRFRFDGKAGQRLVATVSARTLIPYLPDAVPGWFQVVVALYDAQGKELAYADDYRFHPDPVLACELPKDGEYVLEIRDALYRGREDFVYRVEVGSLPFLTCLFPPGGRAGAPAAIELKGWNLPTNSLSLPAGDETPGIHSVSVRREDLVSNRLPFAVDTLPEGLEQKPNHRPETAQSVALPFIINGRIEPPGDCDVFRFQGRAGEQVVAEVMARRLGSPLDSTLKLTDATGRQLAFNDDYADKGLGLDTHHADSWLCATLPEDGTYYVQVGDAQRQGGPEYSYRLRLSPPRPDFELRVAPSSINARTGAAVPLTVYALRKDGFAGEIELVLNREEGFTLNGGRVPPGQDQVRLTLTTPSRPLKEPVSLRLEGRAVIQGQETKRPGVPADDMTQAFSYRHLVPAHELKVSVTGRGLGRGAVSIAGETPLKIPVGGTARVRLAGLSGTALDRFKLELSEPPDGITLRSVSSSRQGAELVLECDASKVKAGLQGNLIVNAFASRTPGKGPQSSKQSQPLGTLPAIPFEVVAPR